MRRSKVRVILAWTVALCMLLPFAAPVLSYADDGNWVLESGENVIELQIAPYENSFGLMVNAEDLAEAFELEYAFDSENKAFSMTDDSHGEIVLMHNATQFYSGDKTYECAPYFYVENGIPMIETGFFCKMFSSSYEIVDNRIILHKGVLSDSIAKISVDGNEMPLYIEPFETELGLIVGLEDLAKAFGLEYCFYADDNSSVITDEKHGNVVLNDKAETFTSNAGEFECKPYYFVGDGIPFIEIGFFCEMYDVSYNYDEDSKLLTIEKDIPFSPKEQPDTTDGSEVSLMNPVLSGRLSYSKGAPKGGLAVNLCLQQIGTRYTTYQGTEYYAGNKYTLGKVQFNSGVEYKDYTYDLSSYYSNAYPYYCLFYEEPNVKAYGYYNRYGSTTRMLNAPSYDYFYQDAKVFNIGLSAVANISLDQSLSDLSGNLRIANNYNAPSGGIDVNMILQTRSQTFTRSSLYSGTTYSYNIGRTIDLGTTHINSGENSAGLEYIVSKYYTSSYPYYTLFYSAYDNSCVQPYGYYNNNYGVTTISYNPLDNNSVLLQSQALALLDNSNVDLILPTKSGFIPDIPTTGVTLNKSTLTLKKGDKETLVATVEPSNATDKSINWRTSDTSVVTVSNGIVTAVGAGTAKVYARTVDGEVAACQVTVTDGTVQPPVSNGPVIIVSNATGSPGKTVNVTVDISGNKGFANLGIEVSYDKSVMTLTSAANNTNIGATYTAAQYISANPYNMIWDSATSNITFNGTLATLTFSIKENAADGVYPISVKYYKGINGNYQDGVDVNYDSNFNALGLSYVPGEIKVSQHTPGDINGDGRVNNQDGTYLLRYLAGWTVDIVEEALDVNGDGRINNQDGTVLLRYLAGWSIDIH
ncbi:MAG: Ig-like domain-containing protein [Clostridia bacterium]|nr:Ig-like domain-containing protein [Clostridia bacterium]